MKDIKNILPLTMDIEYTWMLGQGKNCRQFEFHLLDNMKI